MANKRINPRHIVVDKRNVNLDAIVDEAMKDDMHHAWLVIGKVLKEQEQLGLEEIKELRNSIKEINASEGNIRYAEEISGMRKDLWEGKRDLMSAWMMFPQPRI